MVREAYIKIDFTPGKGWVLDDVGVAEYHRDWVGTWKEGRNGLVHWYRYDYIKECQDLLPCDRKDYITGKLMDLLPKNFDFYEVCKSIWRSWEPENE